MTDKPNKKFIAIKKTEFGYISAILSTLLALVLYHIFFVATDDASTIHQIQKGQAKPISFEEAQLIKEYRTLPGIELTPGKYCRPDKNVAFNLYVGDDQTITKELVLFDVEQLAMYGTAKFTIDGGVIKYHDVMGDKMLFSELGDAAEVEGDHIRLITHVAPAPGYRFNFFERIKYKLFAFVRGPVLDQTGCDGTSTIYMKARA